MTALQSRKSVKGSLLKLKPLMPLAIPVLASATLDRTRVAYYAARSTVSLVTDQAGIIELKGKYPQRAAAKLA
jgi:hypothetical protein